MPQYPRGHKHPPQHIRESRHRVNYQKHGGLLASLPVITASIWDARILGIIPSPGNQKSCGDCHLWSGAKVCSSAQMVAQIAPRDGKFMLAVSYLLDCHTDLGGCDGGDEYADAQKIQSGGCPSVTQYSGDGADPTSCKSVSAMTLYTVANLVMCSETEGVAKTQDIKNSMAAYGYVSVAAAAGGDWDSAGANTTITGNSSSVNHAIGLVGWDDNHDNGDGSKGAWIMQNNWATSWGGTCVNSLNPNPIEGGYAWIKYGADSIGTSAFIAIATNPAPPMPGTSPIPNVHV